MVGAVACWYYHYNNYSDRQGSLLCNDVLGQQQHGWHGEHVR